MEYTQILRGILPRGVTEQYPKGNKAKMYLTWEPACFIVPMICMWGSPQPT